MHMSERHSSSQIPRPAIPVSAGFSERKLQPLSETINGLPAYGNLAGKKFTVKSYGLVYSDEHGPFLREYRVEIDEVAPDRKGYLVVAKILVEQDSVYIHSIDGFTPDCRDFVLSAYVEPPREWKGMGFFAITLEQAKKIARENNVAVIELVPADDALLRHYARHGFVPDPDDLFGRMVYRMDSATD